MNPTIRAWERLATLPAVTFVVLVVVVPAISLWLGDSSWSRWFSVVREPFFRHVLLFTLGQAALSAALAGVVGTYAAFLYLEQGGRGASWVWRLSSVCFAMPTIVIALGMISVWGVSGWITRFAQEFGWEWLAEWLRNGGMYGWFGILVAHVFFNFPVFLKAVGASLRGADRTYEKIALSLGASRLRCFFTFTLPQILPAVGTAFWIVFLYCSSSFVLVLLLGGGPRFTTIEVALYQAIRVEFDRPTAGVLAAVQTLTALSAFFLFARRRLRDPSVAVREGRAQVYRFRSRWLEWIVSLMAALGLTALALPLLAAAVQGASHLQIELLRPLGNSLWIAAGASLGACLLAYPLARLRVRSCWRWERSLLDLVASLPLAFSAVFVVFAAWSVYGAFLHEWRGSASAIAVAHAFFALPIVYRPMRSALENIPAEFSRAASSLGAGPLARWWWIELPLLRPAVGVALSLAAAYSFGELSAVLVFLHPDFETLPLYVYREMGRYRFENAAGAAFCLIAAISALYTLAGKEEQRWSR